MPSRDAVDTLLFGEQPALSAQFVRVAAGLFVLALFAHLPVRYLDGISMTDPGVTAVLVVVMLTVAAVAAYVNSGVLVSIALAAGVGVGFYAPAILFELRSPGEATLWILAAGSFSSVVVGVVGFAVGIGLHRVMEE
ncbi:MULTISPECIES: hypothetical protein [Halolamina]|uniref:Uncharacterized protein n=1 Tax=Halolamina pelagica TaxID=699431 RepID=A0A1I5MAK7_9EURY|nr:MULTISPECIES: hypothetical protein [Halolamina]NHX35920.1 hypothetical protein [Halolamina sp. R1-12]SFP05996.1 hypothetical protein SAMN05216277_101161 [Halolamina pelagica]